jgi:ABC-type uncharacterized transport system permease subunit
MLNIISMTPLPYLIDLPVSIATDNLPIDLWIFKIGIAIFWCLIMSLLGKIIYYFGIRQYEGFGA